MRCIVPSSLLEHAARLGPEIIPLHLLDQVEGAGDGQPAEPVLAFEIRHARLQLVLEEELRPLGAQHFVDGRVERPRQPVNR